jgi:hypothetical protein
MYASVSSKGALILHDYKLARLLKRQKLSSIYQIIQNPKTNLLASDLRPSNDNTVPSNGVPMPPLGDTQNKVNERVGP